MKQPTDSKRRMCCKAEHRMCCKAEEHMKQPTDSKRRMCCKAAEHMNQPTDSKRRICCKAEEHMKLTVAGCTTLGQFEYTNRHNKFASYIDWTICKHMGSQVTDNYYEHIPETAINVNGTTIMWDIPVFTDRTILAF